MTKLSTIFSAWLNKAWNSIKRNPRFILIFLMGLTLPIAYAIRDTFLFLYLTLVILALLTMYVAWLTLEAANGKRDAGAKAGRLLLEFALVVTFGLVVTIIQYEQQERIDARQSIQQTRIDVRQSDLQKEIAARSDYFNAISQLGSLSPVVRISGIDYLNRICMGKRKKPHPDKCNQDDTIELLSNQVRFFTQSKSYQKDFTEEPSGDIAKIIEILKEMQELSNISWEGAYLRGANLRGADLQGADLRGANLQRADLHEAELQGADLDEANLQGADLSEAKLQGANLDEAKLQGAGLFEANLPGADLYKANLQGAFLLGANLQGAYLRYANLQGADLCETNLQGAGLFEANLQGANLYGAKLQGAKLYRVNLQGTYSEREGFPVYFCTRIISRIDKPTEIEGKEKNVLFSGGITKYLLKEMEKTQWHDEKIKKHFLSKMEDHLNTNKDPVYTIPDEFKNEVNTCTLTKETATAIIKEYNESLTDKQLRCELPQ